MYRKLLTILIVVLFGSKNTFAQEFDQMFTFAWDVNIPMGEQFVKDVSYAGGKMEFRGMVSHNVSVGVDVSWNSYYEYKSYQTYHINGSTDVTSDLYKYNYTLPLSLTAHYYFENHGGVFKPYAGIGVGAVYSVPKLFINIWEITGDNWGFLMRPELGTIINFSHNDDMGLLLAARYSYSTNNMGDLKFDNIQSLGFQLGFVWMY